MTLENFDIELCGQRTGRRADELGKQGHTQTRVRGDEYGDALCSRGRRGLDVITQTRRANERGDALLGAAGEIRRGLRRRRKIDHDLCARQHARKVSGDAARRIGGTIVFLHTGGAPALFADEYADF